MKKSITKNKILRIIVWTTIVILIVTGIILMLISYGSINFDIMYGELAMMAASALFIFLGAFSPRWFFDKRKRNDLTNQENDNEGEKVG